MIRAIPPRSTGPVAGAPVVPRDRRRVCLVPRAGRQPARAPSWRPSSPPAGARSAAGAGHPWAEGRRAPVRRAEPVRTAHPEAAPPARAIPPVLPVAERPTAVERPPAAERRSAEAAPGRQEAWAPRLRRLRRTDVRHRSGGHRSPTDRSPTDQPGRSQRQGRQARPGRRRCTTHQRLGRPLPAAAPVARAGTAVTAARAARQPGGRRSTGQGSSPARAAVRHARRRAPAARAPPTQPGRRTRRLAAG